MLWAFWRQQEHVKFFKCEERAANSLLECINYPLERFPLNCCTPGVLHTEGHQQFLCDVIHPQHPQKVQSLLGLQLRGVRASGQVPLHMDSQKAEVSHPLHTVPTDQW
ncbi:hypothetical protein XENORESO_013098 [Xenotaenia resolanae]|uniref:Uncharacterized protein n=1 Tax=Xenotaenia resolanae TaxID=208358 RepID=A0ABV0VWJ7_9TELE